MQIYIDINGIPDLHKIEKTKDNLTLGANVTLSMAKEAFEKYANEPGFKYLDCMANHIDLIASVPIRNVSTKNFIKSRSYILLSFYKCEF